MATVALRQAIHLETGTCFHTFGNRLVLFSTSSEKIVRERAEGMVYS
jgi:hypothetical protein